MMPAAHETGLEQHPRISAVYAYPFHEEFCAQVSADRHVPPGPRTPPTLKVGAFLPLQIDATNTEGRSIAPTKQE